MIILHDGSAADLCYFFRMSVKAPAADFRVANHVFEEWDASVETEAQFVEEFDTFQEIIVRGSARGRISFKKEENSQAPMDENEKSTTSFMKTPSCHS